MKSMKHCMAAAIALALVFAANQSQAALVITEAMSSSGSGGTGDWFELTNTGASPVSVSGYKMDDSSFAFANAVPLLGVNSIAPGESAVFIESTTVTPADEVTAFRTFWGTSKLASVQVGTYTGSGVGLSSTADGVEVFDGAGNPVNQVSFGAATAGVSFGYNPTTSTFGGLSVSGQFGAFVSADALGNIGSPGAVPEPASMVLAALGFCSLAILARRSIKLRPAAD